MYFFSTIKQTQFPCAFSNGCPSRFVSPCSSSISPPIQISSQALSLLLTSGSQHFRSSLETLLLLHQNKESPSLSLQPQLPASSAHLGVKSFIPVDWDACCLLMRLPSLPAGEAERETGCFRGLQAVSIGRLILHLILCFSPGRFLERDMLACLLNVWEYIWKSYSEMSHCSISLAFLILAL